MKRIYLDAGHGGSDSGAVGNELAEKNIVLKIQQYMINYLNETYTGFIINTTRTTDIFLSLSERANRANSWNADIFFSIHVNAGGGTGYEDYIYTSPGSTTINLQNVVHNQVISVLPKYTHANRGKKRANFAVLRQTTMPAILTEIAFIDTLKDANLLKNETFLREMSEAYVRGVAQFTGLPTKTQPTPQPTPIEDTRLYRLTTGTFQNAQQFAAALTRLRNDYPWITYEKADTTELNPTYRIITGTFTGKATAERFAAELRQRYGWTVYVNEA
ncbi:N-acetylmuramoyl-L-alanine amidase [Bacillus sp. CGMCC 1.16541]|uniref:N-acetylmuramoyl-L-alanine amidase n=1 Tax=Bacillus sp. CGMCC 1.16541 TaxID=2185143 RepID=UPI000D72A90B|nr:N-acetylmuramoyl-L-alanine amidase [Bacillus sp. CGMCC 1.16541]